MRALAIVANPSPESFSHAMAVDRVFRPGVAYDYPPGVGPGGALIGLLRARCALVFNTSNTPWDRELAAFGNPLLRGER